MSENELRVLLTGYLDGELDAAQTRRVEEALAADAALRAELASMRELVALTKGLGVDERSDAELQAFWGAVYNRLERRTAWMLLLGGLFGLLTLGSVLFLESATTPLAVKIAVAALGLGSLLMLGSVYRERARVERHDRYSREVLR